MSNEDRHVVATQHESYISNYLFWITILIVKGKQNFEMTNNKQTDRTQSAVRNFKHTFKKILRKLQFLKPLTPKALIFSAKIG